LIGLGAALGVIAGAALLLSPSIPALLGFGAALVVIGAGLALAGAGIALIGVGLSAIAVSGTASVGILVTALVSLVESLVRIAKDLVMGILAIVKAFADAAPKFAEALVKIVASLLQVVIESAPKIAEAFEALLRAGLEVLKNNAPRVIQAGLDLIMALLTGIRNNISRIVTGVVEVITRFLSAISSNLGKIITAGGQILISLLKGIANNLAQVTTAVLSIVTKFLDAIANNLGKMVTAGMNIVVKLLSGIASKIGEVIKAGTDIIVNLVTGIGNAGARIVTAGVNAMIKFVNAVSKGAVKLIDAGMKAVINFLNGVAAAINANAGEMRAAGMNIAFAIADGMSFGLLSRAKSLASKAASIGHSIIGAMKSAVGARSPSKEAFDIGNYVIMGLANGMTKNAALAYSSATNLGNGVIDTFNTIFQTHSPSKVMMEIGKYVGRGFAEGLRGSKEDINKAFTELNDKLTETMATARETIKKEQDKLDELRKAKKPDAEAIRETQKILDENEAILARSTAGHKALVKTLKDEKAELIGLTSDYDKISTKIKAAQQVLADAMKTRDDAVKSYTNQYSTLPALVKEDAEGASQDQLAAYLDALRNQVSAVGTYKATLEQLRKLGLDDATYRKLLEEGTADQEFANQLLAGGKTAIEGLNELDRQLVKNSTVLALDAAQGLYQAGVDSAQGLLNGLESKRNALKKKMNHIAQDILNELRRELKIKSPSQAFAEIGAYAMEGFAEGIFGNVALIRNAVSDTVNETMDALKATMKKAINTSDISMRPVITPVLDLSLVKAKSGELAALTDVNSYSQASAISTQQTTDETAAASAATQITFEQNNYSPEALSDIEIYRQTRNQLSQLKSAFAT
jgi:phage-related protein